MREDNKVTVESDNARAKGVNIKSDKVATSFFQFYTVKSDK